jgi:hypothetical protein
MRGRGSSGRRSARLALGQVSVNAVAALLGLQVLGDKESGDADPRVVEI